MAPTPPALGSPQPAFSARSAVEDGGDETPLNGIDRQPEPLQRVGAEHLEVARFAEQAERMERTVARGIDYGSPLGPEVAVRAKLGGDAKMRQRADHGAETHARPHRRWQWTGLFLGSIFVLISCGTAQISPDARTFGMVGLPCAGDKCVFEATACPATLASTPDFCQLWTELVERNHEALNTERSAQTWGRDPNSQWWRWWKSRRLDTTWSPAKDSGPRPPQLCLAMSGGGLRSAAVNIGVLSGLHAIKAPQADRPVLDQIDIMSAVSGGSSALAWYFTQHWHQQQTAERLRRAEFDEKLFDDTPDVEGKALYQRYLRGNYVTFTNVEYGAGLVANLGMAPVNFVANGVFGWHANTSPMRRWYERRLRKTFQHVPGPGGWSAVDPRMEDLAEMTGSYGMPWPIINATALIENDLHHYGARLGNVVFQFTPKAFGSDAFGRHGYEQSDAGRDFTLGRVVSIASAAFDGTSLVAGPAQSTWWSLLNLDTGMYVHNPRRTRLSRMRHRLFPWPFYYLDNYLRDIYGTDIYLTDGGHAENLGAYALVRRGCTRIIIVDAEHDPAYIFGAYHRLQQGLRTEMGVSFIVNDIVSIEKNFVTPPLPEHPVVNVEGARWGAAAITPVMTGQISQLPLANGLPTRSRIPVLYIKMAYHAKGEVEKGDPGPPWEADLARDACRPGADPDKCKAFRRRQQNVRKAFLDQRSLPCRYNARTDDYGQISERCPYPQRSTKVQAYSADDYDAWRDLGRLLIDAHKTKILDFLAGKDLLVTVDQPEEKR